MPTNRPPTKPRRAASTEEIIVGEHLADLRGRVRLLTWVSGFCWTIVALFGGLLVTGTVDWLMHFDDSGTRLVIGLSLLGGSGWMVWRQLIAPLRLPLSGTFLASRVERRFPGLKNRVLSAVEFLEHRLDSKLGSTELQKAVVGQALDDLQRIETSDVIETNAIRNVTIAGALVCGIAATVAVLHPLEAATSVRRLMFPFASVPWPRMVELKLVRPDLSPFEDASSRPLLIARGDMLELYVENSRGRLPERVWFEYRIGNEGPLVREPLRQTTLRDERGRAHEAAVISWVAQRGTMQFRASGGDDNVMPFHRLEVVPPPNVESLQVIVTPPHYSQRPVEILPPGVGHVQGLLGTKIEITATSDKPLKSAKLRVGEYPGVPLVLSSLLEKGDGPLAGTNNLGALESVSDPVPIIQQSAGEDKRQFSAAFEIKEAVASSYWFELTDTQGFTDREAVRYELRGIADGVPEVTIEAPLTDVLLTADAELPVDVLAKDDLGLRAVRITYQVGDDEKLYTIPLFDRSSMNVDEDPTNERELNSGAKPMGSPRHDASHLWKMADLNLEAGMRIVFRAEATDDYDLGQPHLGKSIPRTITIVSRDEKQKELASRVGGLLEDLRQATQLQQRARQQTQELQTQLDNVGEFRTRDMDQLQRTELDQRQTASRLTHPADGVETQARQLLDEFHANHLSDAGTEQRLERLADEIGRLEREELPDAERALTRAQKLAEDEVRHEADGGQTSPNESDRGQSPAAQKDRNEKSKSGSDAKDADATGRRRLEATATQESPDYSKSLNSTNEDHNPDASASAKGDDAPKAADRDTASSLAQKSLKSALAEAQSQQTQSFEALSDLQDLLSEWRDRRDTSKDLSSVISEQEKIQKDASDLAQQTIAKTSAELAPQEKAELKKIADRQTKVAEELNQFQKQLDQAADSLQKNDPESAEKFKELSEELRQQGTSGKLKAAAQNIAENQMGSAAEAQQEAIDKLHDIERMMKQRPNEDTEQFLQQTQEALQEFQQLREEQQNLADRAQELAEQQDSLEKKQQQDELMEQQERLAERMAKAERKLERLRLRGPAEAAHRARKRVTEMMKQVQEAVDGEEMQQAMEEAIDDLEQVERELVLEKRIAQERLAFEQLEKIGDELKSLRSRQETVIAETKRLAEATIEEGSMTRGQLRTLKELAETERSLQHAAEQMQLHMASAEVFALVLKRLGRSLKLAADGLGERETGTPTQAFAQDAIRKIDSLLAVLKQVQKKQEKSTKPPEKPEELGQEPQEQEEKPEEAQPPGDMLPQLAELKLLKSLQEEYLERTEMLDGFRDKDGKLPESMEAEKNELAREQVELADFARNLIAKFLQQQPDKTDADKPKEKVRERSKDNDATKIDL